MSTSMGHDLNRRDPAGGHYAKCHDRSPSFDYHAHIAALMSRAGVQAWQALMRETAERAKKRRDVA